MSFKDLDLRKEILTSHREAGRDETLEEEVL
jgi:hypothetical protein